MEMLKDSGKILIRHFGLYIQRTFICMTQKKKLEQTIIIDYGGLLFGI